MMLIMRFLWILATHNGIVFGSNQGQFSSVCVLLVCQTHLYGREPVFFTGCPYNPRLIQLHMTSINPPYFFMSVSEDPFFAPKNGNFQWFWVQKNGSSDAPIRKRTESEMTDETLVSYEYHYRVSFGQILKIAYIRLIFGRFPLIKAQNQNPMLQLVNFWDRNLIFGIQFPQLQRQLDLSGWVT